VYLQVLSLGGQSLTLIGSLWFGMKPLNVGLKIIVDKKINNLKEMEIWADIHYLASIILKQSKKKKSNTLDDMAAAISRLTFYFHENLNNKKLYQKAISDYRLAKNRAVERARKAEGENKKLKIKLQKNGYRQ
tara:strand:+ start:346 stop:744 length:399 start_codon:yes stop_codon:yes gene_type:complete